MTSQLQYYYYLYSDVRILYQKSLPVVIASLNSQPAQPKFSITHFSGKHGLRNIHGRVFSGV